MAALVSNWGGEKLPYTMETAMVGSGHRLRIPKALATVIDGSAGRLRASVGLWKHVEGVQGSRWGSGSPVAGGGSPAATATW